MTKEWYRTRGYNVSVNLEQAAINRAEDDIFTAYIHPILPAVEINAESIQRELADLTYLLLMQRTLKVTRSGTKEKTGTGSVNASEWQPMSEFVTSSAFAINRLRGMDGAVVDAKVQDICKLYYTTQFFYM